MPLEPRNQLKALLLTLLGLFLAAEAAILWTGYKTVRNASGAAPPNPAPPKAAADCGPAPAKNNALQPENPDTCGPSGPLGR